VVLVVVALVVGGGIGTALIVAPTLSAVNARAGHAGLDASSGQSSSGALLYDHHDLLGNWNTDVVVRAFEKTSETGDGVTCLCAFTKFGTRYSGSDVIAVSSQPVEGAGDDSRRGLEGRFEVSADGDGFDPMSLNSIAVRDLYTGRTYSVVFTRSACRICPLDD